MGETEKRKSERERKGVRNNEIERYKIGEESEEENFEYPRAFIDGDGV